MNAKVNHNQGSCSECNYIREKKQNKSEDTQREYTIQCYKKTRYVLTIS